MPYNTPALDPAALKSSLCLLESTVSLHPHPSQVSQGPPTSDQKFPAEPMMPRACTSVFPLLWQERRVSSLEAHSVACGRNGDIVWLFIRADVRVWVSPKVRAFSHSP